MTTQEPDIRGPGERERQRALARKVRRELGLRPRGTGSVIWIKASRRWRGVYRWNGRVRYVTAQTKEECEARLEAARLQEPEIAATRRRDDAWRSLVEYVQRVGNRELVVLLAEFGNAQAHLTEVHRRDWHSRGQTSAEEAP